MKKYLAKSKEKQEKKIGQSKEKSLGQSSRLAISLGKEDESFIRYWFSSILN